MEIIMVFNSKIVDTICMKVAASQVDHMILNVHWIQATIDRILGIFHHPQKTTIKQMINLLNQLLFSRNLLGSFALNAK